MTDEMKTLILQYVDSVRNIYGTHLKQVILYGSYARGILQKIRMSILCFWLT